MNATAGSRAGKGRAVLRRLNGAEYENSVRDLLGVDADLKRLFREKMKHLEPVKNAKANVPFYRLSNLAQVWDLYYGADTAAPFTHTQGDRQNPACRWLRDHDIRARLKDDLLFGLLEDGSREVIKAELTREQKEKQKDDIVD